MGDLTKNFSKHEFIVSADHPELLTFDLSETDEVKAYYLSRLFLQPLRDKYGRVDILSGKRSPELNAAIPGSSKRSDHLYEGNSAAVDFTTPNEDVGRVSNYASCVFRLAFGQMIYYPDENFIHVSLPTERHHCEVLQCKRGVYTRLSG